MGKLSSATRNDLNSSEFALPKQRKYPIPDESHGRAALQRASQFTSPELKAKIKAKVKRKFPSIKVEGEAAKSRADRPKRRS